VDGAVAQGVDQSLAGHLFDLMEKFAEYGFNKSHSAAYALVAYHTAYLKAHYPSAFMAATMSADMNDTDKVHMLYEDCLANGLEILAPDVNHSNFRFTPLNDKQIRYGLGAIKGTGESAIASIINARETDGPFSDLFDFCRRVDKRLVNRRVLESLICAGAFDSINTNRATLFASVGAALESAEQAGRAAGQGSLLFDNDASLQEVALVHADMWTEQEKLQNEKRCLGFYFSGHPYKAYTSDLKFVSTKIATLAPQQSLQLIAGIIYGVRTQMTKRGKMAFVALDDGEAQVEVAVFNELFEANRELLKEDQLLMLEGKVSKDDYSGGLRVVAERLYDLSGARTRFAKSMCLSINGQANAGKLKELLSPYRCAKEGGIEIEGCPVTISYHNQQAACEVSLGDAWRVRLHDHLLQSLSHWLDEKSVQILY
jgi:DNA polymerase-3 subunit alpha